MKSWKTLFEGTVKNLEEMRHLAIEQSKNFSQRELILLNGPMGAGKTQWVQFLAPQAHSPTYTFHHIYNEKNLLIEHWDLYRLSSEEALESTGFWDRFGEKKAWIFIEWAEKIPEESWPLDWSITVIDILFPKDEILIPNTNQTLFEIENRELFIKRCQA